MKRKEQEAFRLALGIICGRVKKIDEEEWELLSNYTVPEVMSGDWVEDTSKKELLLIAEDVVFNLLTPMEEGD